VDETDLQILRELNIDVRKPFRKIAKKIGVSTQTVIKRFNEMKEMGTIESCSITININKIGYEGTAHLLITATKGHLSDALEQLKKIKNIIIASKAIGDFEAYAVLLFRNITELYTKVIQMRTIPYISDVEVSIAVPGMKDFPPKINTLPELRTKQAST
jgi:Lrp/AsnC family transcriptional regulator for asnA, asnC and gidA